MPQKWIYRFTLLLLFVGAGFSWVEGKSRQGNELIDSWKILGELNSGLKTDIPSLTKLSKDLKLNPDFATFLKAAPSNFDSWKVLNALNLDASFRASTDLLNNVSKWKPGGASFSVSSNGALQIKGRSGELVGEFSNGHLIPENNKYLTSGTGTHVGNPQDGYVLIDKNGTLKLKREPDITGYTGDELELLAERGHTLERHGHDVTDAALVKRAESPSYAPDGSLKQNAPAHSSKFESSAKLKEALQETGPNASDWSPPSNPNHGATYSRSYTYPNNVPFGYGIPTGGTISNKVNLHRVVAKYHYDSNTGK